MSTDNDQATVDRLCLLTYTSDQEGEPHDCVECADAARAILDAIRNGEVPIPGMAPMAALKSAINRLEDAASLRVERDRLMLEVAQATATWKHAQAERENHWYARLHREESAWGAEKARADKAEAANKLLIDELIPVGWEVLTSAGCPRCGCDVVAEPAMDGDGFVDGNPARCQSCGLPGQVTCDDDGAYFSADDNQWEIEEVAKRADRAAAERDRLAGLLKESYSCVHHVMSRQTSEDRASYRDLIKRIDAALAEVGK